MYCASPEPPVSSVDRMVNACLQLPLRLVVVLDEGCGCVPLAMARILQCWTVVAILPMPSLEHMGSESN